MLYESGTEAQGIMEMFMREKTHYPQSRRKKVCQRGYQWHLSFYYCCLYKFFVFESEIMRQGEVYHENIKTSFKCGHGRGCIV